MTDLMPRTISGIPIKIRSCDFLKNVHPYSRAGNPPSIEESLNLISNDSSDVRADKTGTKVASPSSPRPLQLTNDSKSRLNEKGPDMEPWLDGWPFVSHTLHLQGMISIAESARVRSHEPEPSTAAAPQQQHPHQESTQRNPHPVTMRSHTRLRSRRLKRRSPASTADRCRAPSALNSLELPAQITRHHRTGSLRHCSMRRKPKTHRQRTAKAQLGQRIYVKTREN